VESFRFKHTDKEIIWKLGGIASPAVKEELDAEPQLSLIISMV
jgi:hypothetical protein